MRPTCVFTVAARGGVARRRAASIVIGLVVLVSTAACVLALGLIADSASPFDTAFAAQRGWAARSRTAMALRAE